MSDIQKKVLMHFNTEIELLNPATTNPKVPIRSSCCDITFINWHPSIIAYINDYPLFPNGGELYINANVDEYNESNYSVSVPTPVADAGNNLTLGVWVIRKHYIGELNTELK